MDSAIRGANRGLAPCGSDQPEAQINRRLRETDAIATLANEIHNLVLVVYIFQAPF